MSTEKASVEGEDGGTPKKGDPATKSAEGVLLANEDDSSNEPNSENGVNVSSGSPHRAVQQLCRDPSFAIVCSYFNKFGASLGLKPQHFTKLERLLTSFHETGRVDRELIDLHLTLLRKLNFKSARADMWEKFLLKFCSMMPCLETEFHQLERYGYLNTTPATKLAILKGLCESQFDFNLKFKEIVTNAFHGKELRMIPVGVDRDGLAYWYQQDSDLNIRVYTEEQDDHSGGSWNLVAKSKVELEALVDKLKAACSPSERNRLNTALEAKPQATNGVQEGGTVSYGFEVTVKRGTMLDTFQEDSSLKKKEVPKTSKVKKKAPVVEEEEELEERNNEIPEELVPFLDRRVLPRRSARNAAITHMKELTTPPKKRAEKPKESGDTAKKKGRPPAHPPSRKDACAKEPSPSNDPDDSPQGSDEEEDDDGDEEEDEFAAGEGESDEGSSDDDFMPLSEIKRRSKGAKRRYRGRKKRKASLDGEEMDHDEDDECEEEVKKERKKATDETLCMKCRKSSNPEVLLLCDMCDDAWHTWCVHPMLWFVPDDDWFCPKCQHSMLIEKLSAVLDTLVEQLKRKLADDKRKEAAAERLKREMEYIGVSLNNIIPSAMDLKDENSESSEESEVDDGERKSKKKANRRFGMRPVRPIIPIAVGRSRRHVAKVDYRFGAYDDLIQEAMESIDETSTKPKITGDPARPQGGAGKGKDMANILNAVDSERKSSVDSSTVEKKKTSKVGKPARTHRRLNDLDVDEMTESEVSDEYHASEEGSEESEHMSEDTDEYVPSDGGRKKSSRRRRSDDEFVVSGSESDYEPSRKKSRKSKGSKKSKGKKSSRRRGRRISSGEDSTSEEEISDYASDGSSEDESKGRRRAQINSKWAPRASGSDEDSDETPKRTATGRLARKSASKVKKIIEEDDEDEDEQPEQSEPKPAEVTKEERKRSGDSDFEPDESEVEEEEEDDEDEEEDEAGDEEESGSERPVVENKEVEKNKKSEEKVKEKKIEKAKSKEKSATPVDSQTTEAIVSKEPENKELGNLKKELASEEGESGSPTTHTSEVAPDGSAWKADPSLSIKKEPRETPSPSVSSGGQRMKFVSAVPFPSYPVSSTSASMPQSHPPSVIQQMAQFVGNQPMPRYPSPGIPGSVPIPCTAIPSTVPLTVSSPYANFQHAVEKHQYMGPPAPPGMYNVRAMGCMKQPPGAIPPASGFVPISEGWSPYSLPPNVFPPTSMPPSGMPPSSGPNGSGLPVSDADSLGNALASAMDY